MAKEPKPGRYARPPARVYGRGEAVPVPVVLPLPERIEAAARRARALLRRHGLPVDPVIDLPGGGWRSLSQHVRKLGHPADSDVDLAARLIVAAADAALGGERRDHAMMELGEIDALARVYTANSQANRDRASKPKDARSVWDSLAEAVGSWGGISDDVHFPTELEHDGNECTAYRDTVEGAERVFCEIRFETGSAIENISKRTFRRYLSERRLAKN